MEAERVAHDPERRSRRKIQTFLRFPVRGRYYLQSAGGRYRIALLYTEGTPDYLAYVCREAWHRFDKGLLGAFRTVEAAIRRLEEYELEFQSEQIDGEYYGRSSIEPPRHYAPRLCQPNTSEKAVSG